MARKSTLPALFQEIINHDAQHQSLKRAAIVSLEEHKKHLKRKQELIRAADVYFTGKDKTKGA